MAIDFSKLLSQTEEEREQSRARQQQRWLEDELKERAEAATELRRLTLTEDPEIRSDRAGFPFARFAAERNGQRYAAVLKPVHGEDRSDFYKRMDQLRAGDEIVAHGHEETRRWTDARGQWRHAKEFHMDVPVSPPELKSPLPEGTVFPQSAFSRKQAEMASRHNGMGM